MKSYSKAYSLADLRRFPGWAAGATPDEQELTNDDIAYLGIDFVVVSDPIREEGLIFGEITPEWRDFCVSELGFHVPPDLDFSTTAENRPEPGQTAQPSA